MLAENNLKTFIEINEIAPKGRIVFLGSDYFASLPINELATVFNVNEAIFNRSIYGATVKSICSILSECVFSLAPCKIFLNLGENDTNSNDFISDYRQLLINLRNNTSAEIYVTSIMSQTEMAKKQNKDLARLCSEIGCRYIDITSALNSAKPAVTVFNILKYFVSSSPLNFIDIMCIK